MAYERRIGEIQPLPQISGRCLLLLHLKSDDRYRKTSLALLDEKTGWWSSLEDAGIRRSPGWCIALHYSR